MLTSRAQIVSLTPAAADRVKAIMQASDKPFLRVGVTKGGCAGMEYVMDYADAPERFDEVIEDKGVRIVIAASAVLFLLGAEIDYEAGKLSSRFVFKNPNQTDACGCGESVSITPAAM